MVKLTDLGFSQGAIFETIVSTYNLDGSPNAAPMGAIMQDPQTISLTIFNSSQTSRNLKANRCAVVNLTGSIEVFYKTAFKETNPNGKLPQDWFEKAESVNAPKLRLAEAAIDIKLSKMASVGAEKTSFFCSIEQIDAPKMRPRVYCRAMSAAVEAIVHATRVKVFINDEKEQKNVNKLLETIADCNNVVNRVAPNSIYSATMADLMARIDSWRNKQ